jgi:hypothetical protein
MAYDSPEHFKRYREVIEGKLAEADTENARLKEQVRRLREALRGVFVGAVAVVDVEHLLEETAK